MLYKSPHRPRTTRSRKYNNNINRARSLVTISDDVLTLVPFGKYFSYIYTVSHKCYYII